ncbi:AraC family transcriptional regulator [Paraglaciecola sp. L3A3]|uniref:helix-turn-helix domain-containing protein n=1 Tax=Paraglaciecola sp. L3A3 TaxID=2686358 RepID=UPI00131BED10|nr:helix-turn-helix domain-containing protein [Paraglaciecola sp. L3A3]
MNTVLFNTHDLALIITIYQCLLFSIFLVVIKKGKLQSNILLAAFLLAQAAIPLDNLINFGVVFRQVALDISPNLFYTFGLAYWIESPLLLLYIRSLIYKDFKLQKSDLLYFLPFFVYACHFYLSWLSVDNEFKMIALQGNVVENSPTLERFFHLFRGLFRLFCGVLCVIELHKYQKQIKEQVADLINVDITWLKMLSIGFLVIRIGSVLVAAAIIFNFELGYIVDHETIGLITNYAVMLLISGMIFFSASYSAVFKGIDKNLSTDELKNNVDIKPQDIELLEQYMQSQKPHLNHLLTLDNLANQLKLPARHLSVIINRHFSKNFFEFINQYRVDESKRLLESETNKKMTMLEVMDRAGFNSKATFNTFFKKLVGKTPTQYRKEFWQQGQ